MEDWGSQKIAVREQEDKGIRSKLGKIGARSLGHKREQEDLLRTDKRKRKKLNYAVEQEDWGEHDPTESNTPT